MSKFDVKNDMGLNFLRFFKAYADRVVDKNGQNSRILC